MPPGRFDNSEAALREIYARYPPRPEPPEAALVDLILAEVDKGDRFTLRHRIFEVVMAFDKEYSLEKRR